MSPFPSPTSEILPLRPFDYSLHFVAKRKLSLAKRSCLSHHSPPNHCHRGLRRGLLVKVHPRCSSILLQRHIFPKTFSCATGPPPLPTHLPHQQAPAMLLCSQYVKPSLAPTWRFQSPSLWVLPLLLRSHSDLSYSFLWSQATPWHCNCSFDDLNSQYPAGPPAFLSQPNILTAARLNTMRT